MYICTINLKKNKMKNLIESLKVGDRISIIYTKNKKYIDAFSSRNVTIVKIDDRIHYTYDDSNITASRLINCLDNFSIIKHN